MAGRLFIAAALFPIAYAYLDTVPFVAWTSKPSKIIDQLPTNPRHVQSLLDRILVHEDLCSFDAVIFVEQDDVHASDLNTLSPHSQFVQTVDASPSQRQFPYMIPQTSTNLSSTAELVSRNCGIRLIDLTPSTTPGHFTHDSRNVVNVKLPSLEGHIGGARRDKFSLYLSQLTDELAYLSKTFPNRLAIYTSSTPTTFSTQHLARQQSDEDESITRPVFDTAHAPVNTTLPKGGILKRYQLLTPGLISVLLVTFFVLVPMVLVGFKALASIQSPLRVEAPKNYNAADKKTQ